MCKTIEETTRKIKELEEKLEILKELEVEIDSLKKEIELLRKAQCISCRQRMQSIIEEKDYLRLGD